MTSRKASRDEQIATPLNKKARMENPNPFSCLLDDENERIENPEQVPTPSNGVEEVENRVIPTGGPSSVPVREHEPTRMGCSSQYLKICVLTPVTISECRAHIILKNRGSPEEEECKIHLEALNFQLYNLPFNCWISQRPVQFEMHRKHQLEIKYIFGESISYATTVRNLATTIADVFTKGTSELERPDVFTTYSPVRRMSLQCDVVNGRGELLKDLESLGVYPWLAVLTQMVINAQPSNMADCFAEFLYYKPTFIERRFAIGPGSDVENVIQWAFKLADTFGGSNISHVAPNTSTEANMCLFCLVLFALLKTFGMLEERRIVRLHGVHLVILSALHKYEVEFRGDFQTPGFVRKLFQEGIRSLVYNVSLFSFDWVNRLDVLGKFDPSWDFLECWNSVDFDISDVSILSDVEHSYQKAVTYILRCEGTSTKKVRGRVSRAALQAAPTLPMFLIASQDLLLWMEGAQDWNPAENAEEEARSVHRAALERWFSPFIRRRNNYERKQVGILQQHLVLIVQNLGYTLSEISMAYVPEFLMDTFRDQAGEMLLEIILNSVPVPEGPRRGYGDFQHENLVFSVETATRLVNECPQMFTIPLLPVEVRLLSKLSSVEDDNVHNLGKLAILKMGARFPDMATSAPVIESLKINVLRPWLNKSARRGSRQHGNLSPFSFFMIVEELLVGGLLPSGGMADCLISLAVASSQQKTGFSHQFLADAGKMNQLHECLQAEYKGAAVTLIQLQLQSADTLPDLDNIGHQILECLTSHAGKPVLKEKMQVELCLELLHEMARKTILYERLENRAIETILVSKFASNLMQIENCPPPIHQHRIYSVVREACMCFGYSLVDRGVTMGRIETVSGNRAWCTILKSLGGKKFVAALEDALKELELYRKRLKACNMLVTLCTTLKARGMPIQGVDVWSKGLAEREETWGNTPLKDVTKLHWPEEARTAIYEDLEPLLLLHESEIFINLLVESCGELFEALARKEEFLPPLIDIEEATLNLMPSATFRMVAEDLVPQCVGKYKSEMLPYFAKKGLDRVNMERVCYLWGAVKPQLVEMEFEIARRVLKVVNSKGIWNVLFGGKETDMVELIQAWLDIKAKGPFVGALPKVADLFGFERSCGGYVEQMQGLILRCEEDCTLKDFSELHKREGRAMLTRIGTDEEFALKQLAASGPLIEFLRANLEEDFRNLIDAVEEQSDHDFVQESNISDLVELHRLFRPILRSNTPTFEQLLTAMSSEPKTCTASASQLGAKFHACTESLGQIRHFLSTVANRGLKSKDHMKRILRGGRYHLTLVGNQCDLKLTCGDTSKRSPLTTFEAVRQPVRGEHSVYTLGELQDIRSRARLVLSTHKAQAKHFENIPADMAEFDAEEATMQFIQQVNVVEQLVSSISELHTSGHFRYARFDRCLSGLVELKELYEEVAAELQDWNGAVIQARSTHPCLNYFQSPELRVLLQVLGGDVNLVQEEKMCEEIFQWAGIKNVQEALLEAKVIARMQLLPNQVSKLMFGRKLEDNEADLSACLYKIAVSIEGLFKNSATSTTDTSWRESREFIKGGPNFVKRGGAVVLALVEDPQREHDAVVSLFHNRGLSLRDIPRNVLLCCSTTNWEDIHLLLLRCFKDRTNQWGSLFCIAYVENLSLDCQAQFLSTLQEMVIDWERSHPQRPQRDGIANIEGERLSIVCCSKSQPLLAFSRQMHVRVCHMGALSLDEAQNQLPAECSNMRVVTSQIPGLGKTRRIRNIAPDWVQTNSLSGNISRNVLISNLKELSLQPESILHLDISTVINPGILNVLLFELLVLGCLKSDVAGVFHLNTSNVHVELGNTLGNELVRSLPICEWFYRDNLTWDLTALEVSDDPNSNMQIVCNYLQVMENGQLNTEDLIFITESRNVPSLPAIQCQAILRRHFVDHTKEGNAMSFSILEMFVNIFACQLRNLSKSVYFTVETLQFMEALPNIRMYLVISLLEVARDLSLRSVKPWLHEQQQSNGRNTDSTMAARFEGMLRWSDSNHVMIFFQKDGPISFLYRNTNLLPASVTQLFHSQRLRTEAKNMPEYAAMSSHELWANLWPILQRRPPSYQPNYILTADNFLKMALIALRVEARVPVIIMGETGCGKTSLLKILALYCGVEFFCSTLHAGTTEENIRSFVQMANDVAGAGRKKVWAFLDEINACDHLGVLDGLLCHHKMDGKDLNLDLALLAACNPYRLHDVESSRVGFSARELMTPGDTHKFNLAYRVHPLPEAMLDYVWDFGLLSRNDEQSYIAAMVDKVKDLISPLAFTDLLVQSQAFIRSCHGEASVSLRDVSRCIVLFEWFFKDVKKRPLGNGNSSLQNELVRATLLAFSHCYHSRLASEEERNKYREMFAGVIKCHEPAKYRNFDGDVYAATLRDEQKDLLDRMDVPQGIAKNKALLENVFVTLVCMLNHIPVFVVGKPGSGKTLALQLIYGNLRGTESRDAYFQQLPQMYKYSYQGSESSTSEGILKVFEKAYRCVKDNEDRDVLVVVVLDEIGLAEVSTHNPLKVLHALLEPEEPQQIAVVGISNWSLDAAKMNRAIHLSQPDPSEDDLYQTSLAILESYDTSGGLLQSLKGDLKNLSRAYYNYHSCQSQKNFHGLRDFYSLIKSLRVTRSTLSWQLDGLVTAVWRNFGGSPNDVKTFSQILKENLELESLLQQPPPVLDLVLENLQDKDARHLMVITTGDSAIGILENTPGFRENVVVIHGSKYKDDCSDDYSYLMLSNIILHMEAGQCILLRGVERLWSSLYDMLNQHYTVVGGRRNCRIAIGAYSNPMCYVNDTFRCIVVVDFDHIPSLDPPFLNRFEKQILTYDDMLTDLQRKAVKSLKRWCEQMAGVSVESGNDVFKVSDLFAGYHEDTLPSLVLQHLNGSCSIDSDLVLTNQLDRCKEDLLRTAYADGMVRALMSKKCQQEVSDLEKWTGIYFGQWQDQQCLQDCLSTTLQDESTRESESSLKVVITTRSIIHMPITGLLKEVPNVDVQIEKLGDFSSERQLQLQIQRFWSGPSTVLILQADAVADKAHVAHAKFIAEKTFAESRAQMMDEKKNVVLIIHTHREVESLSGFTFLSGWRQITLDQLHREETDISIFLEHTVSELVEAEYIPFYEMMVKVLTWSFLCIKYPKIENSAKYCQQMVQKICADSELLLCVKKRVVMWLVDNADPLWQASVACNRGLLSLSSSLQEAFLHYIEDRLREPIARLIYVLENLSALGNYFTMDAGRKSVWRKTIVNADIVNIENVPAPRHPEGYHIQGPLNLSLPFAAIYSQQVDKVFREIYMDDLPKTARVGTGAASSSDTSFKAGTNFCKSADNGFNAGGGMEIVQVKAPLPLDKSIGKDISAAMCTQLGSIAACIDSNLEAYIGDFSKIHAVYKSDERSQIEAHAFEWVVRENLGKGTMNPPDLHILMWEKGEKIRAQSFLAVSCLTESNIDDQLAHLKNKSIAGRGFDEYLVLECCLAVLPTESTRIPDLIQNLNLLITLASASTLESCLQWATMVTLEVLRGIAWLVLPPVLWDRQILEALSNWFREQGNTFSPGQILEAVLDLIPDVNTFTDAVSREYWFRFLATFFTKVLNGNSTIGDVNTIARFIFQCKEPTSVMRSVIVGILDSTQPLMVAHAGDAWYPRYMQLLLSRKNEGGLQVHEVLFDSKEHTPFVLLADAMYDSIGSSVTRALLRGEDTATDWNCNGYVKCLTSSLKEFKSDRPLSVKAAAASAFLKATLDAVADELLAMHEGFAHTSTQMSAPSAVQILAEGFAKTSHKLDALKLYLLKVLHMKCGLSLQELSQLARDCGQSDHTKAYAVILEWETMHGVINPLGYDPFWSSSPSFQRANETISKITCGQGNKGQKAIEGVKIPQQREITAAVASRIYLTRSSRQLTAAERTTSLWLLDKKNLRSWDPRWRQVIDVFAEVDSSSKRDGLGLTPNLPRQELLFKTLAAHILLVVTSLSRTSPLQGYMSLELHHLERAFVLAAPDSSLAAFRKIVGKGTKLGEYRCSCGHEYFVGECKKPMVTTSCPDCRKPIGGADHNLVAGNTLLADQQVQSGYIVDNIARSDPFYTVRRLDLKCYRALRLIVHYSLLVGLYLGHRAEPLLNTFGLAGNSAPHILTELQKIIEEDLSHLDHLLACNRETTVQYMHSVVSLVSTMECVEELRTNSARTLWEAEFQRIFQKGGFESGPHTVAANYLEKQKGNDRYAELVEERGFPLFPPALEALLRITIPSSLHSFKAMYMQDSLKIQASPLIRIVFYHEKNLEDLKYLLPLVEFCYALHEKYGFKISRPEAASRPIRDIFKANRGLEALFDKFADSWNAVRENVKGFECRELQIPIMDKNCPLAMCLVEPRDQGIYIVALFEYLRSIQNGFLDEFFTVEGLNLQNRLSDSSPPSVRVQNCKRGLQHTWLIKQSGGNVETAMFQLCKEHTRVMFLREDVVQYDQRWLEDVVKRVAMADPRCAHGQQVVYDDVNIQQQLFQGLVLGKRHLDADWSDFQYEHEAFHRHATILADVAAAIPQEALRPETLQHIQREIEIAGVGAGQFLAMLDLCLGFLRRTGGYHLQPLGHYCKIWLGAESAELVTGNPIFEKIYLKQVVSLYEGLEDFASTCVENLVNPRYRAPLTSRLADELFDAVKLDNGWKEDTEMVEKIPVLTFRNVLKRFMFRYLSVDQFRPDVHLELYLTDPRLVRWPADAVDEAVVDECFPSNLLLQHSYATYMLLAEMYKGGDHCWKRAGLLIGCIASN